MIFYRKFPREKEVTINSNLIKSKAEMFNFQWNF